MGTRCSTSDCQSTRWRPTPVAPDNHSATTAADRRTAQRYQVSTFAGFFGRRIVNSGEMSHFSPSGGRTHIARFTALMLLTTISPPLAVPICLYRISGRVLLVLHAQPPPFNI